jgi:hypothetical protein
MEWYWYISGIVTTLFVQSLLLNVGLARGWVKIFNRRPQQQKATLYNWEDHSGPISKVS